MIRILLADDYTIIRKGVKQILMQEYPSAVIEEVEEGDEWMDKLKSSPWDVIISDLTMPDRGGLDSLCRVSQDFPQSPFLILSLYPKDRYAARAIKAGACGYVGKDADPDELLEAVRQVLAGKKYMPAPCSP